MVMQWKVRPLLGSSTGQVWIGAGCASKSSGIYLGGSAEQSNGSAPRIWVSTLKEQVIAITGKRGSGKSFTLGVIAEGLTIQGGGNSTAVASNSTQRAVLFFDPLDLYWTLRLPVQPSPNAEVNEQYRIAHASGLDNVSCNVAAWVPGAARRRSTDPPWFQTLSIPVSSLDVEEWEMLLNGVSQTDPIGQVLFECIDRARDQHGTQYDLTDLVRICDTASIAAHFQQETCRALRQRLLALERTGLLSRTGTSLKDLLVPGRAAVLLLNRLSQPDREIVVAVLSRLLISERQAASAVEKRLAFDSTLSTEERSQLTDSLPALAPKTFIIMDEAHAFLGPASPRCTRDVFTQIAKEGRNYGVSLAVATQQPSAIDKGILSQVELFISHQLVTESDIRSVVDNMKSPLPDSISFGPQQQDISAALRSIGPGYCIISASDMSENPKRAIFACIRPRSSVHGGIEV